MKKVKFTRTQREKLNKLGWLNRDKEDIVKYGNGIYHKQVGKVWISLMIRNHLIERFQFSVVGQTDKLDFAFSLADDLKDALKEIRNLNYFDY